MSSGGGRCNAVAERRWVALGGMRGSLPDCSIRQTPRTVSRWHSHACVGRRPGGSRPAGVHARRGRDPARTGRTPRSASTKTPSAKARELDARATRAIVCGSLHGIRVALNHTIHATHLPPGPPAWPSTASQLSARPPRANLREVASTLTAQAGPAEFAGLHGRSPEPRSCEAAPTRCVVARAPVRVHPPGVKSRRYAALASTASRLNDRGKYSWLAQLSVRLP